MSINHIFYHIKNLIFHKRLSSIQNNFDCRTLKTFTKELCKIIEIHKTLQELKKVLIRLCVQFWTKQEHFTHSKLIPFSVSLSLEKSCYES